MTQGEAESEYLGFRTAEQINPDPGDGKGGVPEWEAGLETQSRNAWQRREKHVQEITENDVTIAKFEHGQFVAYLGGKINILRNGSVSVNLHVPYEFRHLALGLVDAVGVPLSVDIQVWKPYNEAVKRERE